MSEQEQPGLGGSRVEREVMQRWGHDELLALLEKAAASGDHDATTSAMMSEAAADIRFFRARAGCYFAQAMANGAAANSLRADAERYRHCKAHGHPMSGPQCIAWTYDGRMVLGDTPEDAIDRAMAYRLSGVCAA